ncbi:SIR2 family protein [Apilactobacillus micheneri]|nr:SIR2 family protein [Apilactobacillus micheneri]
MIYDDSSFINNSSKSNHFIIKMHGDINHLESIVLKDKDYLNYENDHLLISNFIKSLLATHTFLFIGYSISDNNLKLIMNWYNYLKQKLSINDYKNNVLLINVSEKDRYGYDIQKKYFNNNNIDLIDLNDVDSLISKYNYNCLLDQKHAVPIYSVMKYLYNGDDFDLKTSLQQIHKLNYVSYKYLLDIIFPLLDESSNETRVKNNIIIVSEPIFDKLIKIISNNDDLSNLLKDVVNKISEFYIVCKNGKTFNVKENKIRDYIYNSLKFNDYINLYKKMYAKDIFKVDLIYIRYIFCSKDPFFKDDNRNVISKELDDVSFNKENNYINYFINKKNIITFNGRNNSYINETTLQDKYSKFNKEILNGSIIKRDKLSDFYKEQLNRYEGISFGFDVGDTIKLKKTYFKLDYLQPIVYDIYNYSIINRMFENNANEDLYELYLKLILITYINTNNGIFGNHYDNDYKLNLLDIDIIIKKLDEEHLKNIINDSNIKYILFDNIDEIIKSFVMLCDSYNFMLKNKFNRYIINKMLSYISNFLILFSYSKNLTEDNILTIYKKITDIIFDHLYTSVNLVRNFFNYFVNNQVLFNKNNFLKSDLYLLNIFSNIELFNKLPHKYFLNYEFVNLWYKYSNNDELFLKVKNNILYYNNIDLYYVYLFRFTINKAYFNKRFSKRFVDKYVNEDVYILCELYINGYIYGKNLQKMFKKIVEEIQNDNKNIKTSSFDPENRLLLIMILKSSGYNFKKKSIEPIKNKYPIINFLYDPENFDYSLVNLDSYVWLRSIFFDFLNGKNKFLKYLKKNRNIIFNSKLKNKLKSGKLDQETIYILMKMGVDVYKESLNN